MVSYGNMGGCGYFWLHQNKCFSGFSQLISTIFLTITSQLSIYAGISVMMPRQNTPKSCSTTLCLSSHRVVALIHALSHCWWLIIHICHPWFNLIGHQIQKTRNMRLVVVVEGMTKNLDWLIIHYLKSLFGIISSIITILTIVTILLC